MLGSELLAGQLTCSSGGYTPPLIMTDAILNLDFFMLSIEVC